jgi:hypothetical protein
MKPTSTLAYYTARVCVVMCMHAATEALTGTALCPVVAKDTIVKLQKE